MTTPEERLNRLCDLYRQTTEGTVMLALNLHEEAYDEQNDDLEMAATGLDLLAAGLGTMYERVKLLCALVTTTDSTKRGDDDVQRGQVTTTDVEEDDSTRT